MQWFVSEVRLYSSRGLSGNIYNLSVFALYSYSVTIGILAIVVVAIDSTASLLAGIHLYRQASFGPLCTTKPGKVALVVP